MQDRTEPTLAEWQTLYELADCVRAANPWPHFAEDAIWGVQNPETAELGFINLNAGPEQPTAVALYLGADGLHDYLDKKAAQASSLTHVSRLQLSFQSRTDLKSKDLAVIKQLGLRYRGKEAWPLFRNHRPGLLPWFLTAVEVRFFSHALAQLLLVSQRQQTDPSLVTAVAPDGRYLLRLPPGDGRDDWQDSWQPIPAPEPKAYHLQMDNHALMRLKLLPMSPKTVDIDFFWTPTVVTGAGERPFYGFVLMVVDPQTNFILSTDALIANPDIMAMWNMIPMKVVQILARVKLRPQRIRVVLPSLLAFLRPLESHIGCQLEQVGALPELEQIKQLLLEI